MRRLRFRLGLRLGLGAVGPGGVLRRPPRRLVARRRGRLVRGRRLVRRRRLVDGRRLVVRGGRRVVVARRLRLVLLRLVVRRADPRGRRSRSLDGSLAALRTTPLVDALVMAREKDLGHLPAAKLRRSRVVRVLEPAVELCGERLVLSGLLGERARAAVARSHRRAPSPAARRPRGRTARSRSRPTRDAARSARRSPRSVRRARSSGPPRQALRRPTASAAALAVSARPRGDPASRRRRRRAPPRRRRRAEPSPRRRRRARRRSARRGAASCRGSRTGANRARFRARSRPGVAPSARRRHAESV